MENNIKISVIISACDNRQSFFARSLDTWAFQALDKSQFEIIIIDDADRKEYISLCEEYSDRLNFQYIKIDKNKNIIKPTTFIPVLSNNVGIKNAQGEIIVITGPETLQNKNNLSINIGNRCCYGLVYKADLTSTKYIENNWNILKHKELIDILQIKGTQSECLTQPPHPPGYAYYISVLKKYALEIGGFDERFLNGLCAEDDDFANRMKIHGISTVYENRILGLHQNHSELDKDKIHISRYSEEGKKLWQNNKDLMDKNLKEKNIVVNKEMEWGSKNLITYKKIWLL